MKRRIAAWLVVALLLGSFTPGKAIAAEPSGQSSKSGVTLEQAIQSVKQFFTIPSKLNEFNSSFDSSNNRQLWRLEWSNKQADRGEISAQVDAVTGEIVSINRWNQNEDSFSKTPTLTVLEARQKGQGLLTRMLPEKVTQLKMQDESGLIPLGQYDSPKYTMNWQRFYKDIKVAMDTVSMTIDMQTGEITEYYLNWTDLALPDPAAVISSEKAVQIFASQDMLQLQYKLDQPWMLKENAAAKKAQLIYGIRHTSNGIIDAISGEPLKEEGYYSSFDQAGMGSFSLHSVKQNAPAPQQLTPEEEQEIANSAQYLSKDQAIQAVNKWLKIPEAMVLDSASLQKDWQDSSLRSWNFNWRSNSSESKKEAYINAEINATSGELLSFHCNFAADNNTTKTMSKEAAQKTAEEFIRKVQAQRWSEIKFDELNDQSNTVEKDQSNWSFHYLRLVNGIVCPDNGIYINVNAEQNQVNSFSMNWYLKGFPSASQAMNKAQANEAFFKAAPMHLSYISVPSRNGTAAKTKLVYMPNMKDGMSMLDAVTGAALDSSGQPIANNPKAHYFQDIQGHYGEKAITLLGQAGIFGESGTSFHPDEKITLVSLLRAMLTAKEGIYSTQRISDEEIMQQCRNLKWIDENQSMQSEVSRELLAKLMIRYLNIDYLSHIQGIYQVPYQDAAGMSADTKAYAALCWGLGIIKADGKTFNPGHTSSRAEAAIALVNTLSIKTKP